MFYFLQNQHWRVFLWTCRAVAHLTQNGECAQQKRQWGQVFLQQGELLIAVVKLRYISKQSLGEVESKDVLA